MHNSQLQLHETTRQPEAVSSTPSNTSVRVTGKLFEDRMPLQHTSKELSASPLLKLVYQVQTAVLCEVPSPAT
jgi:hypothetical protein